MNQGEAKKPFNSEVGNKTTKTPVWSELEKFQIQRDAQKAAGKSSKPFGLGIPSNNK